MTAVADTKHAIQILHNLQAQVAQTGDQQLEEEMAAIVTMLESPVFQQLLKLQISVRQLKEHIESCPPGKAIEDYDFSPQGDLVFYEPEEAVPQDPTPPASPTRHPYAFENKTFLKDEESGRIEEPEISAKVRQTEESTLSASQPGVLSIVEGPRDEFQQALVELSLGREIHSIKLVKPEGGGLGFSVVGLKSENHGELGIFVQQIQPGGTADRDGQLQESDQILAIDRDLLMSTVSHQEAITLLQKVNGQVELIVARGGFTVPSNPASPTSPTPHHQLNPQENDPGEDEMYTELIELINDGSGLGFGIVGVKDFGIVVKTILDGGTAFRDGRLQTGDRILRIGETNLDGMTSDQVANVLRQSGNHVKLTITRAPLSFAPAPTPIPDARPQSALELETGQVPPGLADLDSSAWGGEDSEVFDVDLTKGTQGIGITIAGYVTDKGTGATHSGIFVKSIAEGSAAYIHGNVRVNDQIIEVDGQSLQGFSNVEAVEVLRKTQTVVHLKLARHKGSSLDQGEALQEVVNEEPPPVAPADYPPPGQEGQLLLGATPGETDDVTYEGELLSDEEAVICAAWQSVMGLDVEIVVAQLAKFREGGGLGISLEGTVDIDENGQEVRPHHYIRSILPDGPVGQNGKLHSGDELLEVNGTRLLGLNHVEVVKTLKELPMHVRLVCARHPHPVFPEQMEDTEGGQEAIPEAPQTPTTPITASVEAKMESTPQSPQANTSITKESLGGLAMWSTQPMVIELVKGDRGLGFSILDYQDPFNPSQTVIVIRSLVPGGVAEQDGRLIPGDRLMSVNDINLEDCSLDMAVGALKGAALGVVRIGVAKPLPSDRSEKDEQEQQPSDPEASISAEVTSDVQSSSPRPAPALIGVVAVMPTVEASPSVPEEHVLESTPPDLVTSASKPDAMISGTATPPQPKRKPPTIPPKPVLTPTNSKPLDAHVEEKTQGMNEPASMLSSGGERPQRLSVSRSMILPEFLEQAIILKRTNAGLGLTVHAEKGNGVVVKSIIRGGVVHTDGRLVVGDYITTVNNSSIRNHSNQDARSLIRRCSLEKNDISMSYIPGSVAASYRENPSAQGFEVPGAEERPTLDRSTPDGVQSAADGVQSAPVLHQMEEVEDIRTVRLFKEPGKSLGISIVGGRNHDGETVRGIYIKHVLPESPAGQSGSLKTGDRILEVNGCDLREATHDQAVAIIRNSTNPVLFTVQSVTLGTRPPSVLVEDDSDGALLQAVAVTVVESDTDDDSSESDQGEGQPFIYFVQDPAQEANEERDGEASSSTDSESEDEFGYTWKKLSKKYCDCEGELHLIELIKGDKGLGLSLAGNQDRSKMSVFVVGVDAHGAAGQDGRIQIADEILEINGNSVVGRSHQNASAIIKSISGNKVALVVHRHPESIHQLAVQPITPPPTTPPAVQPIMIPPSSAAVETGDVADIQAQTQKMIDELQPSSPPASSPESTRNPKLADIGRVLPQHSVDDFSKYPNVSNISLMKGNRGLGFAILESPDIFNKAGIFVKDITPGGPADQDGNLRIGDQILAVNSSSLVDVSKPNAIPILKDTEGAVRLTISSDHPTIEETHEDMIESVEGEVTETVQYPDVAETDQYRTTDLDAESSEDGEQQDMLHHLTPDPYTVQIEPGKEINIVIDKGKTGLGLSIVGGTDTQLGVIVVHEVYEQGAAARDSRLLTGDQILSVNDHDLSAATHDEAIAILRQTPAQVKLTVYRDLDNYEIHSVELTRVPGKGLGLSIVGKRNDVGVFISDIVKGGVAEADGRLERGDQILSINGEDVKDARQDRVALLLKASQGKIDLEVGRMKANLNLDDPNQSATDFHATPAKVMPASPAPSQLPLEDLEPHEPSGLLDPSDSEPLDGIRIVNLHRTPGESLGFSIQGGRASKLGVAPICIASIIPGGMADRSRQLQVGDCILTINAQSVEGATHTAAAEMLKQSQGKIVLEVYREEAINQLMRGGPQGGMAPSTPMMNSPTAEEPPDSPPGQLKTVELDRGADGLGFSIVGGHGSPHGDLPIYIKTVFNRGAAAENGELRRGDQIVAVNGEKLDGITHEEAVNLLKKARGKVILTILV